MGHDGVGVAVAHRVLRLEAGDRLGVLLVADAGASEVEPFLDRAPVGLLDGIVWGLSALSGIAPVLAQKAELARIGRYYATESMLVLDPVTGHYDADATPSTGRETLFDFYAKLVAGEATIDRGEHAVF